MTEAEVTNNFGAVLEKLRQGAEIVVERDAHPVALIKSPAEVRRTLSECIALAEKHDRERGHPVILDPDFAMPTVKWKPELQ